MYTYTRNNPVLLVDPDGRAVASVTDGVVRNETEDEIVWIASNSTDDGKVVVIPLEPGESSDLDGIEGGVFKVGPATALVIDQGSVTGWQPPDSSVLRVGFGLDPRFLAAVVGTGFVNTLPGIRDRIVPGLVSPGDARANGWQLPQTVAGRQQAYIVRNQLRQQRLGNP